MKEYSAKRVFLNSLIVFAIFFTLSVVYDLKRDYAFYSAYDKETLSSFFSMKDELWFIVRSSLYWTLQQAIIFVPILLILELTKMKNIFKIILTVVITAIVSIIFIFTHLQIVF